MNRRKFLRISSYAGGFIAAGGGLAWISISEASGAFSIDSLLARLDKIEATKHRVLGEWDLAKILIHCAQSVEYSMHGYPQHQSDLFKQTIGKFAFSLFESKKKMTHGLDQAIPGAPEISANQSLELALNRLRKSLISFSHYQGVLAPHFAYGQLTKQQYALAHVMHFNNHWSEVEVA